MVTLARLTSAVMCKTVWLPSNHRSRPGPFFENAMPTSRAECPRVVSSKSTPYVNFESHMHPPKLKGGVASIAPLSPGAPGATFATTSGATFATTSEAASGAARLTMPPSPQPASRTAAGPSSTVIKHDGRIG